MPITDKVIRMLLVHSRCLLDGVRGRTLKSAELHHDVLVVERNCTTASISHESSADGISARIWWRESFWMVKRARAVAWPVMLPRLEVRTGSSSTFTTRTERAATKMVVSLSK